MLSYFLINIIRYLNVENKGNFLATKINNFKIAIISYQITNLIESFNI